MKHTSDTIFLIGFMASGKSTLGRALADALPGRRFVDLDKAVGEYAGMDVARIFEEKGQEEFRRLESEALRRAALPGAIVACGGGTPCSPGNMDFMLAHGLTVLLEADDDITVERLRLAPGERPLVDALLADDAALRCYIRRLRADRAAAYSRAHVRFDSSRLDTEKQIAESVELFINKILTRHGRTHTP